MRLHRPMIFTIDGSVAMMQKAAPDAKSDMEVLVAEVSKLDYWALPMKTAASDFGAVVLIRGE